MSTLQSLIGTVTATLQLFNSSVLAAGFRLTHIRATLTTAEILPLDIGLGVQAAPQQFTVASLTSLHVDIATRGAVEASSSLTVPVLDWEWVRELWKESEDAVYVPPFIRQHSSLTVTSSLSSPSPPSHPTASRIFLCQEQALALRPSRRGECVSLPTGCVDTHADGRHFTCLAGLSKPAIVVTLIARFRERFRLHQVSVNLVSLSCPALSPCVFSVTLPVPHQVVDDVEYSRVCGSDSTNFTRRCDVLPPDADAGCV